MWNLWISGFSDFQDFVLPRKRQVKQSPKKSINEEDLMNGMEQWVSDEEELFINNRRHLVSTIATKMTTIAEVYVKGDIFGKNDMIAIWSLKKNFCRRFFFCVQVVENAFLCLAPFHVFVEWHRTTTLLPFFSSSRSWLESKAKKESRCSTTTRWAEIKLRQKEIGLAKNRNKHFEKQQNWQLLDTPSLLYLKTAWKLTLSQQFEAFKIL